MTTFLIIAAVLVFIIYLFQSDKKEVKTKNLQRGGLATRFPNFIAYTKQAYTTSEPYLQFVKDDGQFLEYKFPVRGDKDVAGHYHLGIESVFGTFAYVFAISSGGQKINGYMRELHNGRSNNVLVDRAVEEYDAVFDSLITQMEKSKDFDLKFYGYAV
jgi:hypothetical protein